METILNIKYISTDNDSYIITTDKQEIEIGIGNYAACCEQFGILESQDNLDEFIGAELMNITLVNDALNSNILSRCPDVFEAGGIIFVNLNTSKGTFQIALYNSHNGYYGHNVYVKTNTLNYFGVL